MARDHDLVPISVTRTVGATAVAVSSATSQRAISFIITAADTNGSAVWIGDSNVTANGGISLSAGESIAIGNDASEGGHSGMYDLKEWYAIATQATQQVNITAIVKRRVRD